MTYDAGRIRHDGSLMHYSRASNGSSVPSNWRLSATGDTGVVWSPESASAVSYGSNANAVGTANAGGASSDASRADHVHLGVRGISSNGSNTLVGDVNLAAGSGIALGVAGQSISIVNTGSAGGGGSVSYGSNSNEVSYANAPGASSLVSRADHIHLGVTSVSHSSNTFSGPVILTASGALGITVPTPGTLNFSSPAAAGGGGGGSDLVQTISGGGSVYIPGLRGSPDRLPGSPSAFDDEFESLSGWTTLGTLDTNNVSDVPSHLHIKRTLGAVGADGLYKTAPSMPFTVTIKFGAKLVQNYDSAGILLTEASPGKLCTFGLVSNSATYYTSIYRWTNRSTFSTNIDVNSNVPTLSSLPYPYIRLIVASSTDITGQVSHDGMYWHAPAGQSNVTSSLTVANVGVYIGDAAAAGTTEMYVDWIRFT